MSTPPPNYPPPGPMYYGSPPPQQNSGSGCLKAAGITCGVLLLLGIVGVILTANFVRTQIKNTNSMFGQVMSQGMKVGEAAKNGKQIQQAIVQYKAATGKYPPRLESLVPQYLPDAAMLHSAMDPNPSPTHMSWRYIYPTAGSQPTDPMLILPYTMTMTLGGKKQVVPGNIIFQINGEMQSQTQRGGIERTMPSQ